MGADTAAVLLGKLFALSNGAAGWLLTYVVHSTAWLLAGWLFASRRALRDAPALQHAVWTVATLAGVATTTLQLSIGVDSLAGRLRIGETMRQRLAAVVIHERITPGAPAALRIDAMIGAAVPIVDAGPLEPRIVAAALAGADDDLRVRDLRSRDSQLHESRIRTMVIAPPLSLFAIVAWGLVAAALIGRLAWAHRALARALSRSTDASATSAGVALRHLQRSAGVDRPVALLLTDAVASPAAVSTNRIALPPRLLAELTPLEQEGVLAHELAHIARRDTLWLRLALAVEALAWFQPLHRLARHRLSLAAEFAADAWAVRLTRHPVGLARSIARIAEWVSGATMHRQRIGSPASVLGADGSPLLQRVRRLTDPATATSRASWAVVPSVVLVIILAGGAVATLPSIAVGRPAARAAGQEGTRAMRVVMLRRNDSGQELRMSGDRVIVRATPLIN